MKKILAVLALATIPFTAFAHGPTPQKVEKEVTINAAPAKVWAVIKDFGGIHKWMPLVTATKLDGDKRTLTLKDGGTVVEKLKSADDSLMMLKYDMQDQGPLPFTDYYAVVKVAPGKTANESSVTWTARFYRTYKLNPPIPAGQDDETAIKAGTGIVDAGLAGLKKYVEAQK